VDGDAIALGHPFGMTGARISATLLNGLVARNKTVGLETMWLAADEGMTMIVERLSWSGERPQSSPLPRRGEADE
jgi:acetyl-CoA C-acetyltransferase